MSRRNGVVSAGCLAGPRERRAPPPSELQRQAGSAAEQRLNAPSATSRVRQGREIQTALDVLSLARGDLDEATIVRIALINNPGLDAEYADLGIAHSALVRALQFSNPSVETSARFRDGTDDAVDVKVMQDIADLALLPRRREAAERLLAAARDRMTSRIMGVAREARAAFVE